MPKESLKLLLVPHVCLLLSKSSNKYYKDLFSSLFKNTESVTKILLYKIIKYLSYIFIKQISIKHYLFLLVFFSLNFTHFHHNYSDNQPLAIDTEF